jgi:integrase
MTMAARVAQWKVGCAGAAWDEIDLEAKLRMTPPSRMKKKRQHVVPLSPEMIDILIEMQTISSRSPFVFSSEVKAQESMNAQSGNMALKRMGYEGKLVAQGLRSLASTAGQIVGALSITEHGASQ